jgi:predicted transposase/invertase (TIGR01784 family)
MYMKYRHEEQAGKLIKELCRKEEGIMRAEKTVNGISRDYLKAAREMAIIKNRLDRGQAQLNAQLKAQAEGHAEGHAKGLAEGHAKGLAEGIEKGTTESKLEIARNLKKMGLSVSQIAEITGLSPQTIQEL